jgi:hypothetical protein
VIIISAGKQEFRSSVISTDDVGGILKGIKIKDFRAAHIADPNIIIFQQNIFWF